MRVQIVDPSAYTPPYDHALCAALAAQGAEVTLVTSRFAHGELPAPAGYARSERFYPLAARVREPRLRRAVKLAEHVPDMLAYRRVAAAAQVVHFQWLAVQQLDWALLPRGRPLVITAHDVLPREGAPGQRAGQLRLYRRFDAVVVHSRAGERRLVDELGLDPARVHVIAHGVLEHLTAGAGELPAELRSVPAASRVVLCFGLMRPYKGLDVLLDAWGQGLEGAELWLVGMPRMDIGELRERAGPGVRILARYVADGELAACFSRADLVVLPYRQADQSGVLFTALAFGRPLLLSDVGGFPELARTGAARCVPAGDALALRAALAELLADPEQLRRMRAAAAAARSGEYSWPAIARRTLELYETLL